MLQDIAAERGWLAGIVKYGANAWIDSNELINDNCFSDHLNQCIYTCLERIFHNNSNAVIDLASILSAAQEIGLNDIAEPNNIKYIKALANFGVESENVREFAKKIRKLSEFRSLLVEIDSSATRIKNLSGNESISEAVSIVEKPIFDFCTKLTVGNNSIQQIGSEVDDFLQYIRENRDNLGGIDIGYPRWQKQIGGLHSGVHVIGARKKTGKSIVCMNAALYAAIHNTKVLFLDTEMRLHSGGYTRFLTRLSDGVEQNEIKYGTYLDDDIKVKKVEKAARILKKIPLDYLNVTGKNFDEVISIIRRWINQTAGYNNKGKLNNCLVIYDYLKISDSNALKEATEWQLLGYNMTKLHDVAETYSFPILTATQLNREHMVSGSDRVSWLAVSYSSLHKRATEEIVESPELGNRRLVVEDARFGESMDDGNFIGFTLNGKLAKFIELKTRNELNAERETSKDNASGDSDGV